MEEKLTYMEFKRIEDALNRTKLVSNVFKELKFCCESEETFNVKKEFANIYIYGVKDNTEKETIGIIDIPYYLKQISKGQIYKTMLNDYLIHEMLNVLNNYKNECENIIKFFGVDEDKNDKNLEELL